jgi:transcriptional regulator with XRE-family HTH domain
VETMTEDLSRDDPSVHKVIGRLLGDARQKAGLSQSLAAERLGISQSWLARIELGQRRLSVAEAAMCASLYGVPFGQFDPRTAPKEWFGAISTRRSRTTSASRRSAS